MVVARPRDRPRDRTLGGAAARALLRRRREGRPRARTGPRAAARATLRARSRPALPPRASSCLATPASGARRTNPSASAAAPALPDPKRAQPGQAPAARSPTRSNMRRDRRIPASVRPAATLAAPPAGAHGGPHASVLGRRHRHARLSPRSWSLPTVAAAPRAAVTPRRRTDRPQRDAKMAALNEL